MQIFGGSKTLCKLNWWARATEWAQQREKNENNRNIKNCSHCEFVWRQQTSLGYLHGSQVELAIIWINKATMPSSGGSKQQKHQQKSLFIECTFFGLLLHRLDCFACWCGRCCGFGCFFFTQNFTLFHSWILLRFHFGCENNEHRTNWDAFDGEAHEHSFMCAMCVLAKEDATNDNDEHDDWWRLQWRCAWQMLTIPHEMWSIVRLIEQKWAMHSSTDNEH